MDTTVVQKAKYMLLPDQIVQQAIAWCICFESGNAKSKDLDG